MRRALPDRAGQPEREGHVERDDSGNAPQPTVQQSPATPNRPPVPPGGFNIRVVSGLALRKRRQSPGADDERPTENEK